MGNEQRNGLSDLIQKTDKRTIIKYVQFSKRIVTSVTVCITVICGIGMLFCQSAGDMQHLVQIVKAYCNFSTIAFVSYSVNSLGQKFVKASLSTYEQSQEQEDDEEGGIG